MSKFSKSVIFESVVRVSPICLCWPIGPVGFHRSLVPLGVRPALVLGPLVLVLGPGPPAPWPLGCPCLRAGAVLVVFSKPPTCDVMLGRRVCEAHAAPLCIAVLRLHRAMQTVKNASHRKYHYNNCKHHVHRS